MRPFRRCLSSRTRLTYLDIKGYAEPIRLALSIGGVSFVDRRVSYDEVAALRARGELAYGQVRFMASPQVARTRDTHAASRHSSLTPAAQPDAGGVLRSQRLARAHFVCVFEV